MNFERKKYFMNLAMNVALYSKDPSTKVGAVLVRPDMTIASTGYNGFPKKIEDREEWLLNRDEKLLRTVHAESNAIRRCRDHSLDGYILVTTLYPCSRCALEIIDSGVSEVVALATDTVAMERWEQDFLLTTRLFRDANVAISSMLRNADNLFMLADARAARQAQKKR